MNRRLPFVDSRKARATTLLLLLAAPCSLAQDDLTVDLRVPTPLQVGQVYDAELRVKSQKAIPDAYVKISLPYALKVVSGQTSYRGSLDAASEFVLRATFQVTGTPAGIIAGKALAYYGQSRSVFGRGQILYCRAAQGGVVLSDKSPEAEEDLRLEAEIEKSGLERASTEEQRLRRNEERTIVKEDSGSPKYRSLILGSEAVPENALFTSQLNAGEPRVYRFSAHRGDRIWITARSEGLDPRLVLLRSDGSVVAEDDDGAGLLNARIPVQGVFELSSDDTYFVVVYDHRGSPGNVRLHIQNFTHLESPPGSILPIAKPTAAHFAGSPAADASLTARIVYNAADGGTAPLRFALVKLFADVPLAADPEISSAQTDINGDVSLRVPQANLANALYLQVFTRDLGLKIAWVRDPGLLRDPFHSAESSRFRLPAATSVTFGTWNVAGTGQNGPFLIFDAAVEGYLISTQVLGFTPPTVSVNFPIRLWGLFPDLVPNDQDAHYDPKTGQIYLHELFGNSPDTVLHEYGHFISDKAAFFGRAGGKHTFPFGAHIDPIMAWNEGWATFLAVAGQNARGKPGKRSYVSNHPTQPFSYDLETGHDPDHISDAAAGDDNEGSVQFVLWDLYDNLQDYLPVARAVDTVALGLKPIFDVARDGVALYTTSGSVSIFPTDYLEKFYDGLFQQLTFTSERASAIQAVFSDQQIRWETPPAPPTNLRFVPVGSALQLQWQPGSGVAAGYVVQQGTPGQASFATVATVTSTAYSLPTVSVGATFRIYAFGVNSARFAAPLRSGFSPEITYTAPPPPANPVIALSKAQLTFTFNVGGAVPAQQTLNVSNAGGGTLSWTASANAAWLSVSPTSGTAPSTVSISVTPGTLTAGTYAGTVTVSSQGIASQMISVSLVVTAQLRLGSTALSFTYQVGGSSPPPQSLSVTSGGSALGFTTSVSTTTGGNWLSVSPATGNTPATLTVGVNPAGLSPGSYTGKIVIRSGGASSSAEVNVTLQVNPLATSVTISSVVNGASFQEGVTPVSWVTITGKNLSRSTRTWTSDEIVGGLLPISLDGVRVNINRRAAYVYYISPTQINVQAPSDEGTGPAEQSVEVEVIAPDGTAKTTAVMRRIAPAVFTVNGGARLYAAAVHPDGSLAVPEGLFAVTPGRPVQPGDMVSLFATGLGPTNPMMPAGRVIASPAVLQESVGVSVAGAPGIVSFAGLVGAGLYQINVTIPEVPDGDQPTVIQVGEARSQNNVFIAVRR